jgi:hypothetical protein
VTYFPIKNLYIFLLTNEELQAMYRKPNIITTIKLKRLEWAGHLVRMSDGRTLKKVFLGKPYGRRKSGRPKLRWLHCTEDDLKSIGVKMYEESKDSSRWSIILMEALVK